LKAEKQPTFFNLFKSGSNLDEPEFDVFMKLFAAFLAALDQEKFHRNEKKGKAFTGQEKDPELNDRVAILPHSEKFVIEGTIEGGKFGGERGKASLDAKKIKEKVKEDDVITEKYYFFLHVPLNSDTAILMMQSYSSDSITDMFLEFLKKFFKNDIRQYKPAVSQKYVPPSIIKEFQNEKESIVKSFTYKTKMLLGHLSETTIGEQAEQFVITVKVESVKGIKKGKIGRWIETFGKTSVGFGNSPQQLSKFANRKASIKNEKLNKSTSFELSNNFDIKPVIYLTDSKIKFKSQRVIDFDSLRDFCFKILTEVEADIYKL
jgi:hypothetical protein